MELHQSFGTDYRTIAACQIKMRDILDKPQGRLHATSQLIGQVTACYVTSFLSVHGCLLSLKRYKELSLKLKLINQNSEDARSVCVGVGADSQGAGTNYGLVEYWVRLKVPMEQALRLFKVSVMHST